MRRHLEVTVDWKIIILKLRLIAHPHTVLQKDLLCAVCTAYMDTHTQTPTHGLTSGAMYGGVPQQRFNFLSRPLCRKTVERPKSETFNTSGGMKRRKEKDDEKSRRKDGSCMWQWMDGNKMITIVQEIFAVKKFSAISLTDEN